MVSTVTNAESQIRALIEESAEAVRARDPDLSLAGYARDVVGFDLIEPLRYEGRDALRTRLESWFSSFEGDIGYENRDLTVAASDDVAFAHSRNHVTGTLTNGRKLDMWWRATLCLRKLDGRWMVTHTHASVPFDMETLRASVDLAP
jgi:uncharacterized protein (TIGR02246 family)